MENQPNIKIIIAAHKECTLPANEMYLPVHVGAACSNQDLAYTRDDTGDNISSRNPTFCELTGLYWAWKNLDYDWLGLVHYRRLFSSRRKKKTASESILSEEELLPLLEQYKVFVPRKRHYFIESVYSHYDHTFDGSQFDLTREILLEKYPDFVADFDSFMLQRSAWLFNMMIMQRTFVDQYCTWLFDILFELEKRIDTSRMTDFEKRYAGRVGERLFNVWLNHELRTGSLRKGDIKELPYIYLGKVNWWKKCTGFLKAKFLGKKYKASF